MLNKFLDLDAAACPTKLCGWPVVQLVEPGSFWAGSISPLQRKPRRESRRHFCLPVLPFLTALCLFHWDNFHLCYWIFFQKTLEIADACSCSSYVICNLHTPIDLSVYPTLRQRFLCFTCQLIPDSWLTSVAPQFHDGRGGFLSSTIYIFN